MLSFFWNDSSLTAREGQSVAAALLASGRKTLRITSRGAQPRGLFCGMGICFDCLVHIDGRPNQRACQILVTEGMRVLTQQGAGVWEVLP
jgi:predicted molibdopterin-dependent oxidoreductase YjgC